MNYDSFATTFSQSRKNLSWPELDMIIDDIGRMGYQSVLDIGCGNGRFLEEAKKRGYTPVRYLGIDNSMGMIEEARTIHRSHEFCVIPMEALDTLDQRKKFDAIVFLASFHHLDTKEKRITTLKSAKELLSPSGRIYMTNWNLLEQEKYQGSHRGNGDFDIKIGAYTRYYH